MSKRSLLVTGASRGIGAAVALAAAREGYRVAINYVSDNKAAEKVAAAIEKAGRARRFLVKADVDSRR